MSEFKKLFRAKRILAMILAVAMAVTSIPATANAAPLEPQAEAGQTAGDALAADDASDGQTDDDQTAPSDDGQGSDSSASQGSEEDSGEVKDSGAEDNTDAGDNNGAEDNTDAGNDTDAGDNTDAGSDSDTGSGTENDPAADGEEAGETGSETTEPAETEKEYVFSFSDDIAEYTTAQYRQGEALFATETEAADGGAAGMTVNASVLECIELRNIKDEDDSYNLRYASGTDIVKALTYVWKQDGKELDQGKSPRESGSYQLVIKLEAKAGEYKAAETTIDFSVTKAKVDIDFSVSDIDPGALVSDVALNYASAEGSDGTYFTYLIDDKATDADEAADNEVAFDLIVKEAATNNVLQSNVKLVKNKEYVVSAVPKFIGTKAADYAKNYEFNQPEEQSIVVNDLIATKVKLTLNAKYDSAQYKKESNVSTKDSKQQIDKITIKSYDGSAIASTEPQYTVEVGVPGVDKDGKETFDAISGTVTKTAWHSAVYESWTEGETGYCNLTVGGELESAPTDAGFYVYRVTYEGDEEQYAVSSADIVVEIEDVDLIIQPKFDTTPKSFFDGQTAADVLAQVEYELPYVDKEGKFTIPADKADSFWGTSFVNNLRTQPFEPVFEVVKTVVSTANGTQTSRTVVLDEDDLLVYDEKGATTYEVRFTGYKAVYNANGVEYTRKGINDPADSTNSNYVVKADQETLEKYTAEFEVKNVNAEIDTSAVVAGFTTNPDFHDAAGKTYDGARLYTNRADYKKAQLKSKDTKAAVPGVLSTDLTYKWYRSSYKTIMDTKVLNSEGIYEESDGFKNSFSAITDLISPVNAGIYKLEVSYKDKEGKYFAEPAEVYFVIEQQELKVTLADTVYSEFSGITVEQFLNDTQIDYSIGQELNTPAVEWQEYYDSYAGYPYTYTVTWQVEEKQRDADGNALKDEKGNDLYRVLQDYESFVYDEQYAADSYRLSVADFECYNSNFTVSEVTIETVASDDPDIPDTQRKVTTNLSINDDNTAKITVEKMGSTIIRMEGMITKEKDYNGVSIYDVLKDDLAKIKAVKENEDGTTTEVTDAPLTYIVTDLETGISYELEELSEDEFNWWAAYDQFINGGEYTISAYCRGDAIYAPMDETVIAAVTVNRIPLKITPPTLQDTFTAGSEAYSVSNKAADAFSTANIEGYLERDKAYFSMSALYYMVNGQTYLYKYGYSAWYDLWFDDDGECYWTYDLPYFSVYDKDSQSILDGDEVLKGEGQNRYELTLEEYNVGGLTGRCARNYDPVCGEASPITVVRGNAALQAVAYSNILDVDATDSINGMTHQFKVQDGIQYTSFNKKEGNFVAVEIVAPAEYAGDSGIWNRAVYEASLTGDKSGGEIVRGSHNVGGRYAITAVFDASKGDVEFAIRWEEDYIETFKLEFSKATCLGNLGDAVSPKTIAFNAPNKTMVVGATQNLDVKITKVQKDDVICLGYEVTKGQEYLCVNEYGKVTALKAGGSATVTVYPMHLVDGVKTPIEGANVKKASVTIKVKDVTAPKVSKVTPLDYSVTVQYPYVKDVDYNYGYRREIYVLEGKNLKEQVFKDKIDAMSNEQWEGVFAAAPVFLNNSQEANYRVYDSKKHSYTNTVQYVVKGLKPNTDYTVYVRNVSAVRTLSDGCQVTLSAAGGVKGFTTTKSQVKGLEATVKDRTETDKEGIIGTGSLKWIEYEDVKLSEGSVQLQVKGYYESSAKDPAAEPIDANGGFDIDSSQPWLLPLSKDDKKYYVDPKINYYFWAYADREGYYDAYTGQLVAAGEYYRSATSSIASINKKGKLTLKQPGWVELVAVDTTTGIWSNQVDIKISADADAIKAKATTLQVGQSMRLEDMLVYSEGKKVLDQSWYNTSGRVDRNGLKEQIEKGGFFELSDGGYVTAVKGKGNIRVTLTDRPLNKSVQVTIKSTDLAPVKNLKMVDVIDNRFTVQFERNPYAEAYRIDVKNARGNLIRSVYAEDYKVDGLYHQYYDEDGDYVGDIYDNDSDWDDDYRQGDWHCYYDKTTRKTYGEYTIKGLTQQSKYTVTVCALYKDVSSKAVSKGVTTTKLPASERDLAKNVTGGINIYVWNYDGYTISSHPFVSGNNYTLVAEPDNWGAKYAATDTLIWSSSNKKAATIKANAGSYSATLKAVRNGETTIEVKSKITKKVIARYNIVVRNVGDAYSVNEYYGDNEDLRGDGTANKPAYTELTLGNPGAVDLGSGQTKWFVFTAPEDGIYNFYRMQNGSRSTYGFNVYNDAQNGSYMGYSVNMTEGQTVYVQATASGSYTINVEKQKGTGVSDRTPLEIGSVTMQVTNGQYFVFTAEGEGLYRFSGSSFTVEDTEGNRKTQGNPAQCWLDDGETVYLRASGSGLRTITVEKIPVQSLTADGDALQIITDDYGKAWFSFTAPKAAEYEFVVSGTSWNSKYIYLYNRSDISSAIDANSGYTNDNVTLPIMLGSGTTVLIDAGTDGNKLAVNTKATVDTVTMEEDKDITLTVSKQYFEFHAPADGFYRFTLSGASGASAELYKDLTSSPVITQNSYSGDIVLECYLKSGQHAYLVARSLSGEDQADVTVKVENFTPETIKEEAVSSEIAAYSDKWFGYTASADEKYTFTFTDDAGCYASLYTLSALESDNPVSVKELYLASGTKHFDYEMTAGQTVYWKVTNNNYSTANVTAKAEKYTIPVLIEGNGYDYFDIEVGAEQVVMFTASEAAKYTFRFNNISNASGYAYLYKDSSLSMPADSTYFDYNKVTEYKYNAVAGETLYWKVTNNSPYYDMNVGISVEKFTINSMTDGSNTIQLSGNSEKYYSYTAPEDGEYIFAFKNDSGSGSAYKYPDVYFESYDEYFYFYSSSYRKTTNTLSAGQTVYWKIQNNSGSDMEVTAVVKKNVPEEITADGASAEVASGLEQWFSFTAAEDAIYRFTFTSDTSYCYAYFYRDQNESSEGSSVSIYPSTAETDERYIEGGTTVYWRAAMNSGYEPTNVTIKAEKVLITAVAEGEDASAVVNASQTQWFAISIPESDAEYIITMITTDAQCQVQLYNDLLMSGGSIKSEWIYSGAGRSKNWTVSGNESGKVYLKVTNSDSSNDTMFKVSVKKRTEETISGTGSAVTIAPGAEQWFSFTSAEDTRYTFTLTSDAEECQMVLYDGDSESSKFSTLSSEYTSADYYIPQGSIMRWKVTNQSAENSTSVTVTANAVDIQEISTAEDGQSVTIAADSSQWFKYSAEEAGRCGFTFTTTTVCYVYLYSDLSAEEQIGSYLWVNGTQSQDYPVSGTTYFKVVNGNSSSETECTVKAEPYSIETLDADTGYAFDTKLQWLKFTAAQTGLYSFSDQTGGSSSNRYIALYKELGDLSYIKDVNSADSIEYSLNAGETVYLKVYSSGSSNVTGTLTASVITVVDLNLDNNVTISLMNKKGYAEFIAPETGIYSFKPAELETDTSARGSLYLYADINSGQSVQNVSYSSTSTNSLVYPLFAGDTVYVQVRATNTDASELKVNAAQEHTLQEFTLDQEQSLSLTQGEENWFCFRPSEGQSAYYYMNGSWDGDGTAKLSIYTKTSYNYWTWNQIANTSPVTKYNTFSNESIYASGQYGIVCICIVPEEDVDITYSIATSRN